MNDRPNQNRPNLKRASHNRASRDDLANRSEGEKPRIRQIGSLVNQLISRRGYAQVLASQALHDAIAGVLDSQMRSAFQVGNLRGGVLQIYASDSVALQELNFRKRQILRHLQSSLPESKVTDLRFRIQV